MTTKPTHGFTKLGHAVHGKTIDHFPAKSIYGRINKKLAIWVTAWVGSMTCAYLFAVLAFAGLPTALKPGNIGFMFWLASDFFQLVLLSVIIVGQNIQAAASDVRAEKQFEDTETIVDRLDCNTQGGIKVIIDLINERLPA
jgi:uncharacterized membrane protein YhdT